MAYYVGIDIGSLSCDTVILDQTGEILASAVVPTGAQNARAIERSRSEALQMAGIQGTEISAVVSTGYGRRRVEGRAAAVTEITCHARGIRHLLPDTRVLIDIGGQDSKAMAMDERGHVVDFAMNDKCAAGTGRFLEAMARALEVDITELPTLDHGARGHLTLSSMCTVFAESEVVSLIADGTTVNEIVSALNRAIASRVGSMVKRVAPQMNGLPVAMSGGVAYNTGVVRALAAQLDTHIQVTSQPDIVGALGAALLARERHRRSSSP